MEYVFLIKRITPICLLFLSHLIIAEKPFNQFTLISVLYNETHAQRREEYITCLEKNLNHQMIKKIHILYDTERDDDQNILLQYLKSKDIVITYIKGRPTYGLCFNIANENYPNSQIILSNADIFFNETLNKLDKYDLENKFLAMTRWNVQTDGTLELFKQFKQDGTFDDKMSYLSMDVWIFKTPLKAFVNPNFQLGTWACDGYIAYQAYISGFDVKNPCLSIQCCHLHQSAVRHWIPQSIPGAKALINPWCTL